MRILQIGSHAFGPVRFGETTHLQDLVAALRDTGNEVSVAGIDAFDLRVAFERFGMPQRCAQLDSAKDTWLESDLVARISLVNNYFQQWAEPLITEAADVVHLHTELAAPAVVAYCRRVGLPLVFTVHTVADELAERHHDSLVARECISALQRHVIQAADVVIAPSTATAVALEHKHRPKRLVTIPHPLWSSPKPKTTYSIRERPARLLFVGRLTALKGLHLLPAVLAGLSVPIELWVVGTGPDEDELRSLLSDHGLSVRFYGQLPRSELYDLYPQADILIFPSLTETYGLAVHEAMAAGLPVIAHDIPSLRERLQPGYDSVIVPLPAEGLNHAELWRNELRRLLTDERYRVRLGTAAHTGAGGPTWTEYFRLYKSITRPHTAITCATMP